MDGQKLMEQIDRLQEAYIQVWETVCNIESPTEDKTGVDAVCAYFVELDPCYQNHVIARQEYRL